MKYNDINHSEENKLGNNQLIDENIIVDKVLKWITDIIVVIMVALFFLSILGEKTVVEGNSMSPSLKNGESVLVDRMSYKFDNPDRFDVIIFKMHEDEETNYYIKRVIGLPGESVQIKNGRIHINGEELEYNLDAELIVTEGIVSDEIILEEDEYFVVGDNWNNSEDSRFEQIGNVNKDNILGKIWIKISPIKEFGLIE